MNKLFAKSVVVSILMFAQNAWADEKVQLLFDQRCAACHGAQGVGIEGMAPPLQNPDLWKALGVKGSTYIAGVMTGGMSGTINVGGVDYRGLVMPPQSFVSSEELALIAGYVVKTLNAGVDSPSVSMIDEMKAKPMSHAALRALRKGN